MTCADLRGWGWQVVGDIRDAAAVEAVCKGADCVWHNAAAVGPFHPIELYTQVDHPTPLNPHNTATNAFICGSRQCVL